MTPVDAGAVEAAARLLRASASVLFVTGAGISADSGLPTYRGVGGLYEGDATEEGLPLEVLLSGPMLRERPDLTWRYLGQIERACRGARPNRAHEVIALLARRIPRCVVLTQNVDGLHRDAGSEDVLEVHGSFHDLRCTRCQRRERVADYSRLSLPPRCPDCSGLVRPDVVLFGEPLPEAVVERLERELALGFDAVFVVGTTAVFPYVSTPVVAARAAGAGTVEVNPGESEVSVLVGLRIRSRAAAVFDAIWSAYGRAGSEGGA